MTTTICTPACLPAASNESPTATSASRSAGSADNKRFIAHGDHEPSRDGRARSPLRAADAVNVPSSRGAHGVTRPTGNGRTLARR
jgi:hypothetical protein